MRSDDLILVSVDDHVVEPATLFDQHLPAQYKAQAPRVVRKKDGSDVWVFQGEQIPNIGLNAVVGRPLEEYGMEPTSFEQLRPGTYNIHERIRDMNVNGVLASMCFPSFPGLCGTLFFRQTDKPLAHVMLRAYNDWHIDEWCGSQPGRFIPCALLPTWDMKATVDEVRRIAAKGCTAVSLNENPTVQGLPSVHNAYWDPLWKVIVDHDMAMCLHIGAGNPVPHASMETPIEAWISTMPMSVAQGLADWLQLEELHKYPQLRIAISEGSIGWVPYFMERADFSNWRHKTWTKSRFQDLKPSEMVKRHFLHCFLWDPYGLKNLDEIGENNVAYEVDYPHSDALWPDAAEHLWEQVKRLPDAQIEKVSHQNAIRWFRHDQLFANYKREEINVGALHARAKARGVDTAPKSSGGSKPLTENRPVTSGDIMQMFKAHADARDAA